MIVKHGDHSYWEKDNDGVDRFKGYTIRHRIRLAIGVTGSVMKGSKEYWFFGISPNNKEYHLYKNHRYQGMLFIYNNFLKKITPILNKIL